MRSVNAVHQHEPILHRNNTRLDGRRGIVVGGGPGGGYAAYELASRGADVTVLSKGPGRLRAAQTLLEHGESNVGGMRIPDQHCIVMHIIAKLGLTPHLRPFINYNNNGILHLRGKRVRQSEAKLLAPLYGAERLGDPREFMHRIWQQAGEELGASEGLTAIEQALCNGHPLAYTSLHEYCRQYGLNDEEIAFLGHVNGFHAYDKKPMGEMLIEHQSLYGAKRYYTLSPSLARLPEALLAQSGAHIVNDAQVEWIDTSRNGVVVGYHTPKGNRTAAADFAIVSAPAPAVARMRFIDPMPAQQQEAFSEIGYASSSKMLIESSKPFWLSEGIDGGISRTDLPITQSVFPTGIGASESATFAAYYTWEADARRMMALSKEERYELSIDCLEKMHPGCRPYLGRYEHMDWDTENGGGAFACFNAGDYPRFYRLLSQAHPVSDPKVFFCGEHIGLHHGWAESALQSAQSALIKLFDVSK